MRDPCADTLGRNDRQKRRVAQVLVSHPRPPVHRQHLLRRPPRDPSFTVTSLEPIVALSLIRGDFRHLSAHFPCHSLILGVLASLINPTTPTAAYRLPLITPTTSSAILYACHRLTSRCLAGDLQAEYAY